MPKHAKFAPSGAHRWIPCPGSIRMSEGIEESPSVYALEGTSLHEVSETCLREKKSADEFIGTKMTSPDDDPSWSMEFDEGHAEAVQYCVDEVQRIAKEYGVKGGHLEVKVELNDKCWGTVDVLLYNDEYVIVIDFKFGKGKSVIAEGNPQLMIYYLGALKFLFDKGVNPPKRVLLVILQPRIPSPFRSWETTLEEVKTWYVKSVKPAFEAAEKPDAVCNPGEEQCQWCPARAACTARSDYLLGIAEEEFKDYARDADGSTNLPTVSEKIPSLRDQMDTSLDMLTPEIAARILGFQNDFESYFKAIGEYALAEAERGTKIPGYKLVYGKSNRKWDKPESEVVAKLKDLGVKEPHTKKLLSPAQAEKKVGKKKGELADFIIKPKGKIKLALESDTREPVEVDVEHDFVEYAEIEETVMPNNPTDIEVFEETPVEEDGDIFDDILKSKKDEESANDEVKEHWASNKTSSPPNKKTLKYQLLQEGLKGRCSIEGIAAVLFKEKEGNLMKSLRNLHERDGYVVTIYNDNTFTIKE